MASENEGATAEAVDILEDVAEAVGIVGPSGRGGEKELMKDMGAAGGSLAEVEVDG